jgi:hypothetical protein
MRVNIAAAVGAAIALLLAAVGHAAQPAQVVVTLAASFAFLALLTRRGRVAQSDWFTVRVLLIWRGALSRGHAEFPSPRPVGC